MVSLDAMTFQVLDVPPASYDAYIVTFGRANTKQMLTQTDNISEEECQTDVVDVVEKWTQHPAHDYRGFGGDVTEPAAGQVPSSSSGADAIDLFEFLQNSSSLMLRVLEDELSSTSQKHLQQNPDIGDFSTGFQPLNPLPFLRGCPATVMSFSPANPNYIVTGHRLTTEVSPISGYIYLFSRAEDTCCLLDVPQRILFSPAKLDPLNLRGTLSTESNEAVHVVIVLGPFCNTRDLSHPKLYTISLLAYQS
ncbi:unnamed protein product [Ixodes hexagonus]